MKLKKVEKQLKKINQLFDTIKEDGIMSSIERDLMKSYVRNLYEKLIESDEDAGGIKKVEEPFAAKKEVELSEVRTPPVIKDPLDAVRNEVSVVERKEAHETVIAEPVVVTEIKEEVVEPVFEETPKNVPQEVLDLFEFESGKELSDKLSRSPISDLTKSMGINEKIFTVQELFGGDSSLFSSAMDALNKFTSLDQAKDYLIENVAIANNWASEAKMKKAAKELDFITAAQYRDELFALKKKMKASI